MFDLTNAISIWALCGVILMVLELVIPGGIVIFLGGACLITAASLQFGFIEGTVQALTLWFITSIILLISFRQVVQKLVGGETTKANTDEVLDVYGKTAIVTETIGPGEKPGRVQFQETSWQAIADGQQIQSGETVTVICQDNISLLVEKN